MDRPIEELITDRTLNDVLNNTDKGNYNASDLNRIEEWCEYLSNLLNEYAYTNKIETKTDWQVDDLANMQSHINRIKNNLEILKSAYVLLQTTPTTDLTKTSINYIDANNIEKILYDINEIIIRLEKSFVHLNQFELGQGLILP